MLRLPQYVAAILAASLALCRAGMDTCNVCDEGWAGGPGDGCHGCDAECGAPTCPDNCPECPDGREYMCKTYMVRAPLPSITCAAAETTSHRFGRRPTATRRSACPRADG